MIDPADTAEALEVAREAAADARRVLLETRGRIGRDAATEKTPRDLVTEADTAAEERIVARLSRAFPDHTVVAEESDVREGLGDWRWFVDPLDGTTNFVHDFPVFAISIALYRADVPAVAVVVDVVRNEWFTARAGAGARVDAGDPGEARPIEVSRPPDLSRALVATGFPFRRRDELDRYVSAFRAVFDRVSDMRRAGSAALDLAWTAAGRVDGFWELGLGPWDTAAGEALVREAGGRVSDWHGGATHRETGWIVAGSPAVHAALVETLERWAR